MAMIRALSLSLSLSNLLGLCVAILFVQTIISHDEPTHAKNSLTDNQEERKRERGKLVCTDIKSISLWVFFCRGTFPKRPRGLKVSIYVCTNIFHPKPLFPTGPRRRTYLFSSARACRF